MKIEPENLRVYVFRSGVGTKVGMRIVHISTGTVVQAEGISQYKLKEQLLKKLEEKINGNL